MRSPFSEATVPVGTTGGKRRGFNSSFKGDWSPGFTLLELVMVLFIVGVALSIVLVSIGRSYEKRKLREEASRVYNTLRYAHEYALMKRVPTALGYEDGGREFWLERDGTLFGPEMSLPEGLVITGENPIVFLPNGSSRGGGVSITEKERNKGFYIAVDPVTSKPAVEPLGAPR